MGKYKKTIISVVGSVLLWLGTAWVDGSEITRNEWLMLAVALATSLGVYQVKNDTS